MMIMFIAAAGGRYLYAQWLHVEKTPRRGQRGVFQAMDASFYHVAGAHYDARRLNHGRFKKRGERNVKNSGECKCRGDGGLTATGFEAGQESFGEETSRGEFLERPSAPQPQFPQPRSKGSQLPLYVIQSLMPDR